MYIYIYIFFAMLQPCGILDPQPGIQPQDLSSESMES